MLFSHFSVSAQTTQAEQIRSWMYLAMFLLSAYPEQNVPLSHCTPVYRTWHFLLHLTAQQRHTWSQYKVYQMLSLNTASSRFSLVATRLRWQYYYCFFRLRMYASLHGVSTFPKIDSCAYKFLRSCLCGDAAAHTIVHARLSLMIG